MEFIVTSVIAIIAIIGNVVIANKNRQGAKNNKGVENLVEKRIDSIERIRKLLLGLELNDLFIKDYDKCTLMTLNKKYAVIPQYYIIFETLENILKHKKDLDIIIKDNCFLNYRLISRMHIIISYIDSVALFYRKNYEYVRNNRYIKILISMDYSNLINKLNYEIYKFYNKNKFNKFDGKKIYAKNSFKKQIKLFNKIRKDSYLFIIFLESKGTTDKAEKLKVYEKYMKVCQSCKSCNQECLMNNLEVEDDSGK